MPALAPSHDEAAAVPAEPLLKLFLRFLKFGSLAWGGPVAQLDMIRQELVTEEKWISMAQFKRLLAIYQVLPGPEAHEMCVHIGMMARGRMGGIVAGLGFMLPGFILMFALSWLYLRFGLNTGIVQAIFLGIQPAIIALIVRACHRIGSHCLTDRWLWGIGLVAAVAALMDMSFYITLPAAGLAYMAAKAGKPVWLAALAFLVAVSVWKLSPVLAEQRPVFHRPAQVTVENATPTRTVQAPALFASGLRAGLLTFGGAYTAIPFLREDAVERGAWMTERDFLDGVALSGILPAPLIIFSTFVGYVGGGPLGALAITVGIFLPAFAFSLLFYRHLEDVVHNPWLKHFLEGVTAGVVGLIAVTTVDLALIAIPSLPAALIFVAALFAVYRWKSKLAIPVIILAAGAAGALVFKSA